MKRGGYALALLAAGILIHHSVKLRRLSVLADDLHEVVMMLLDESYQNEVDAEFDEIVDNHLGDLEDE